MTDHTTRQTPTHEYSCGENATDRKVSFDIGATVREAVARTPVDDIHTHLYDPAFGSLLLSGIDDLLTYHYLVAESFRHFEMPYDRFWSLSKTEQADLIWDALFIQHSPISEACRGVLTTLNALGLDANQRDLPLLRKWFAAQKPDEYLSRCLEIANVRTVCMTNSPFDDEERPLWQKGFSRDERFTSALRIDPLLLEWNKTVPFLQSEGYDVTPELSPKTRDEVRRFLMDWSQKIGALYVMVSLPPDFIYPASNTDSQSNISMAARIIESIVAPFCRESGLPLALMMGVKRAVNSQLKLAGDGVGKSDISALENLCARHPDVKFLVTMLSRENQHELCVVARKFRNLHPFGCWWFTNVPHLIGEISSMRTQLLGLSFTPQHSDARVLDQLIYKWKHSREVVGQVLAHEYSCLAATGWTPTQGEIERDVKQLLGGGFHEFLGATY